MIRLGLSRRLFLVVVVAVAVGLSGLVAGFNVLLARELSRSADNLVRARAASELALLHPTPRGLRVGEATDDAAPASQAWVFSQGRALESPRAGEAVTRVARSLAGGAARSVDVPSADTRLYALPAVVQGRRMGTIVAGISLVPYEQSRRTALLASLVLGGVVLLLVALAARWLLSSSLRPVRRMTRQAAAWSEHDLDKRFALGAPHDELTELAATLDGLLDRLAASLRRERRFSAELSHELRTPLSRVIAEAELALRRTRAPDQYRASLELIQRSAEQLAKTVDALVAAARHEGEGARGTSDAYTVAAGAAEGCAGLADERALEVILTEPLRPIRLGVDPDVAQRILQPVVENACRYGRQRVRISIERRGAAVAFAVEDDGPGVAPDERERIFEPGVRGQLGVGNGNGGAGLGLALARRLARSVSGDVELGTAPTSGSFVIRLPAG